LGSSVILHKREKMHPDTKEIAKHMRDFGSHILGRAVYDSVFNEMTTPYSHGISVTLAAHAAEILIKARIVQEHPLLIFDTLPKSTSTPDLLTISELFEKGKTIQYSDLPEILWATTGYRIKDVQRFKDFGKLRNMIMHFAVPDTDNSGETLKFVFEVVDPMLQDFWDDSVIPYAEILDEVMVVEGYLQEQLKVNGITVTSNTQKIIDEAETE
jgi:hypothetical protein